ncbi:MAG: C10 family peptidase [Bacteroidales bacterium]|nr:C10 family peptidase [Bacteroidales bacterium]
MKRICYFLVLAALAFVCYSCSDAIQSYESNDSTRGSVSGDFLVTQIDANLYVVFKATGKGTNIAKFTKQGYTQADRVAFDPSKTEIKTYPEEGIPSFYILNYPTGKWEILSADKRTTPVIAAGYGRFVMDEVSPNLAGWIKSVAKEISELQKYPYLVKNCEARLAEWNTILSFSKRFSAHDGNGAEVYRLIHPGYGTRSGAQPDTSSHPVPGHYELVIGEQYDLYPNVVSHLTSTKWGENAPFNQYCPKNRDIPGDRAPAGSETVAGGQIVYYMHYASDACPAVYGSAFCSAYIDDNPMDWTNMEQYDKSASNWADFQTSDSTRMAAILLANIGSSMQMTYGVNYSHGDFDALQSVLLSEYDLESYCVSFADATVNPYEEIRMMLDEGIPSIVHSNGDNTTNPYTFIVDGYKSGTHYTPAYYTFIPDDQVNNSQYFSLHTDIFIMESPVTYFCMNWGDNGGWSNVWLVDSGDWHVGNLNYDDREALLSFRMDGSTPWGGEDD